MRNQMDRWKLMRRIKKNLNECGTDAAFISVAGKWLWPQAELVTFRCRALNTA